MRPRKVMIVTCRSRNDPWPLLPQSFGVVLATRTPEWSSSTALTVAPGCLKWPMLKALAVPWIELARRRWQRRRRRHGAPAWHGRMCRLWAQSIEEPDDLRSFRALVTALAHDEPCAEPRKHREGHRDEE